VSGSPRRPASKPASPVALDLMRAQHMLRAGQPAEAIPPLQRAALCEPRNATIHHDLGLACLEAGRFEEAAAAFRNAISTNPRYADAYFRLGVTLEKSGHAQDAIYAYDKATALLPSLTEAWYRAGALVYTFGHRQEAIGCFRRAAAAGTKTSFGRLGAARALLAEDRDGEAEKQLRQLLALDKTNALALDLLGNLLAESGRFDEAWICYERAIQAAPLMAGSYYDMVRCRRLTAADEPLRARMHAALQNPALEHEQRLRLHLALGKAADDLAQYREAMDHFDEAERMRRCVSPFDATAFTAQVDRLISLFTPAFLAQRSSNAECAPVLITGMPRSGTTLVEQILSCHKAVAAGGELNFWNEHGIAWLQSEPGIPDQTFLGSIASDYLEVLRKIGPQAGRVTDKMPFNFLWAGLIHLAFPAATIIHCRRSALDTAISIHQTNFNRHVAFPTGGPALIAYFEAYHRLTAHWRAVLPSARFIEVEYEALTSTPEPEIRRIIAACGLDWDAACLAPEHNARQVKTPSRWQTRQPIYYSAVQRWRRYEPYLGALTALVDKEAASPTDAVPQCHRA
jgi:Flp pilus assembly protein TadD